MYNTANIKRMNYRVKAMGKLVKNNSLVLILRNNDNGFITFTLNTRQP